MQYRSLRRALSEHILDVNSIRCKIWLALCGNGQRQPSTPMYSNRHLLIVKRAERGLMVRRLFKGSCIPSDGYHLSKASARYPDVGFRCCRGVAAASKTVPIRSIICPTDMVPQEDFCIDQYEYPNLPANRLLMPPSQWRSKPVQILGNILYRSRVAQQAVKGQRGTDTLRL